VAETTTFTVRVPVELKERLEKLGEATARSKSRLAADAIARSRTGAVSQEASAWFFRLPGPRGRSQGWTPSAGRIRSPAQQARGGAEVVIPRFCFGNPAASSPGMIRRAFCSRA